jgi:hypothetical protein
VIKRRRLLLGLWGMLLCMATLACWSSDTLFIQLTATPLPTPTQPVGEEVEGLFKVGDTAQIAAQGVGSVYLTEAPEPVTRRNRVANANCYPNSTVTIMALQRFDDITYYQVACNVNAPGWLAESFLIAPA